MQSKHENIPDIIAILLDCQYMYMFVQLASLLIICIMKHMKNNNMLLGGGVGAESSTHQYRKH